MTKLPVLLTAVAALLVAASGGSSCPDDLHRACAKPGCVKKVRELLKKDASGVKKGDAAGKFPLNYAADEATAEALLEAGADLDSPAGAEQTTALWDALYADRVEIAKILLDKGADAHAALSANAQTMSLSAGVGDVKLNTAGASGATPLSLAKSDAMKKLLTDHGAR